MVPIIAKQALVINSHPMNNSAMFHVVLLEPEIPPNTGNIIRLCANTGTQLHLIHPLGFSLDDSKLKRAGLDYGEYASIHEYADLDGCYKKLKPQRIFAVSTHGKLTFHQAKFQAGDVFMFGPETRGLPQDLLTELPKDKVLRIPMLPTNRSLNLSNAVAVVIYEAWRQLDFKEGI